MTTTAAADITDAVVGFIMTHSLLVAACNVATLVEGTR
jgi:hypothetical protein